MDDFIPRYYIDNTTNEKYTFDELISKNNISIILGEPASGKTFQLEEYKKQNNYSKLVELLLIEYEEDITNDIEIVLFDSIDEALSKNDGDKILIKKLLKYIKTSLLINPNVKFIITCRYVEWKEIFEEKLKEIDNEFKIYYIQELSNDDINKLLIQYNINQDEFWNFIEENYLEELLKNILMIIHLIKDFDNYKGQQLKYFEIYEKIIINHLAIKTDNERTKVLDVLSNDEVFKILSLIAIYMTLNRQREINIENILKLGTELYKLDGIEITGEKLKLIFDTSLFNGNIKNTRFFHKSIQEYLSAYFINIKKLDLKTIKNIFAHKEGFYEEFEEVIIYLTNMEERFFYHFVEFDPFIFRRHPYLNESEQKALLVSMLNILSTKDRYKAWNRREYIQDSSLTKFDLIEKISQIVLNNIDINKVTNELLRYLKSLLKFNYDKKLEDIIFKIFENCLVDKNSCINYISVNKITNFEFNKRLFVFIKDNNLFSKETISLQLFIFQILYKKLDFKEIFILLYRFDMYSGLRIINKIDIEDIVFLFKTITENYGVYKKNFLSKQVIHLIFLVLQNTRALSDKTILYNIFDFIASERIYLGHDIHRYKDKTKDFNFDDIKDQFWKYYFKQDINRLYNRRVLSILSFYEISLVDIKDVSTIYHIEKYKDHYISFRSMIADIDDFLMQNIEFKNHMEEIWKKHEEQEKEWRREDEEWKKEIEERDKKALLQFEKAKEKLNTIEDVYIIYDYIDFDIESFDEEENNYSYILQNELKDKYIDFMQIIKNEFIKNTSYKTIKSKVLENEYSSLSYIINLYFKITSEEERKELINNSIDYEKFFWHKYKHGRLHDGHFIEISKLFQNDFIRLVCELFELAMIQSEGKYTKVCGDFIFLFKDLSIFDKYHLKYLLNKIKYIEIDYFKYIDDYEKRYLLELLALDENNYEFIKELLKSDLGKYGNYFESLMQIDINKAINNYMDIIYPQENKYLKFTIQKNFNNLKPNYKFNNFDIINISFEHRKYFISLLGLIYHLNEDRELDYIKNIDDEFIKFILENYFDFFKEYFHPTGTYSPDIYDNMDELIRNLLSFLGNDITKIILLEELSSYPNERLQTRVKYQLNNLYNLILKNREFNNDYYKDKLDNFTKFDEDNRFFDYEKLKNDLIEICLHETENRKTLSTFSEDEMNDRFRTDLLVKGYFIADQSRGGESESSKSVGERDIVIRNKESGIVETVLEAFNLENLDTTIIEKHYQKLILKYDTTGNKQNFILVYSKAKDFNSLWDRYKDEYIETEEDTQKDNLKIGFTKEGNMTIVHLFINFYSTKEPCHEDN